VSSMNIDLLKLRLAKLWASLSRPSYWNALVVGVAPAIEHRNVLRTLQVDGVIDVGANRGQFSLACRFALPGVPVVAFEPIPKEAETFRKVHGARGEVTLIESALGETKGAATLHLSKSADSSSLLPIGKKQTELFENTVEIGTITVPVHRLDDFAECWVGRSRQLLKLDVQGYELNVLRGAAETLRSCAYVYAECSEVALYDGQALRVEVEAFLGKHGFKVQGRYNEQMDRGQLIQADYLFSRAATAKTET
jgi:FkbM family methyltransferase